MPPIGGRNQFLSALCLWVLVTIPETWTVAQSNLAQPSPAWDAIFNRADGWTGADAMYSVDLGDGRVLWLFADTWIGRVEGNKHQVGSTLVNNSLAMHEMPNKGGDPPKPEDVRFLWGPNDGKGKPTAWIRPADESHWYWLADGIATTSESGQPRLYVFLWRLKRAGKPGVWDFQSAGGALAAIDNPRDDWSTWRIQQFDNPHAAVPSRSGSKPEDAIGWGAEVLLHKDEAGKTFALVYGARKSGWGNELLVARAPSSRIEAFDQWEFLAKGSWSKEMADASPITRDVTNELSVSEVEDGGRRRWVLVCSELVFGDRIFARVADSPLGPFSAPKAIFRVPDVKRNKKYFTYAAKGHPELSKPGELLVTYVVNSFDFGAMFNDAEIYHPRFIRVPLSQIMP